MHPKVVIMDVIAVVISFSLLVGKIARPQIVEIKE